MCCVLRYDMWHMTIKLDEQTQNKLRHASEQTGIPEPEVINRALDVFLLAEEMQGLKQLKEDMDYWQNLSRETLALTDKRIAKLNHDERGDLGQ